MFRVVGLVVGAICVLTFLVHDSMHGISLISHAVIEGKDAEIPFHSVGIRIISSFMQVAGMLNNFRLDLPDAVTTLVTVQSSSSGIGGAVISFNCLLPTTRGAELFLVMLTTIIVVLPLMLGLLVVMFWTCNGLCCKKKLKKHEPTTIDKMVGSMIVLYYLSFPSILQGMTQALSCTTYGPTSTGMSRVLLDGALSIECYKSAHIAMLATIVLPSSIIFVALVPIAVVATMHKIFLKEELLPHQSNFDPASCYRYGFFFLGYEQEFYGWEVLVMLRKASFVVVSGLLRPYGPVAQVVGASSILILALSAHLQHRPYDSEGHDIMESVSLHASLFILMTVLLCSMVGQTINGKLGETSSVMLIISVFIATYSVYHVAFSHITSHSHNHDGLLGKISRCVSKKSFNDRRHSIHNLHLQHVFHHGNKKNLVKSASLRQVAPRRKNASLGKHLTVTQVRKAVVVAEAEKIEMAHSLRQEEQANALKLAKKKHESKTAQRLAARKANLFTKS